MTMVVVEEMGAMGETTVHLPMNNQDILAQKNPLGKGNYCHFMYLKLGVIHKLRLQEEAGG